MKMKKPIAVFIIVCCILFAGWVIRDSYRMTYNKPKIIRLKNNPLQHTTGQPGDQKQVVISSPPIAQNR
jgi:hypothetical protein